MAATESREVRGEVRGGMPLERIEAELTELAGQLAAGECRWLLLVSEYDRREGYLQWGCRSCAQWLSWQCGLDARSAREKLRVARALDDLPVISREFAAGKLSYSKVRALTRIATPDNEADLAELAEHATAVQVERVVRGYRRARNAADERSDAERQHAERFLRLEVDDAPDSDGSYVVSGRIPADVAAALLTVFESARALVPRPEPHHDSADDSDDDSGPAGPPDPQPLNVGQLNVDALAMMAESWIAHGPASRKGGDRHMVTVYVDANVLAADDSADDSEGVCAADGCSRLAPETARRLMCDSSIVWMLQDADGKPVNVSTRTRSIPSSLRRAVHARDQGCDFPGCGRRSFTDIHHIRHRAHGGDNTMENLVELCWFHHRLVHEGGWNLRRGDHGQLIAIRADGTELSVTDGPGFDHQGIGVSNRDRGVEVTRTTAIPKWYADPIDVNWVIDSLGCIERRAN